jgi:hypothetical protein
VVDLGAVQGLIGSWWCAYDHGSFDRFGDHFTADAHFSCRSDSGQTEFEEFVRADVSGRDAVVAWQVDHRTNSPYPLRHFGTNVHLTAERPDEADFRSYLLCTQVVGGTVSNLASGVVAGTVRHEGGSPRFADLRVVLDFTDSVVFSEATLHPSA